MRGLSAGNINCLIVYQLPSHCPELNPIGTLWKKVKKEATDLRWFRHFTDLAITGRHLSPNWPTDLANWRRTVVATKAGPSLVI
jgi:transposase